PTRLLEIGNQGERVRVRAMARSCLVQYLTLSHNWGQSVHCKLLSTNLQQYQQFIPTSHLSKTFREATLLTATLGFSYIWIDALCIIQDSAADWQAESTMMGDIYAHGVLNIAATASRDGNGGLFRSPIESPPCVIRFQDEDSRQFIFLTHNEADYYKRIDEAPLASRAWVLQERLLSPRTVHFTSDQVFWECYSSRDAEILPDTIFPKASNDHLDKTIMVEKHSQGVSNSLHRTWAKLVRPYTLCQLTFGRDKLPAISGLASRLASQWGLESGSYLAGLWKESLVSDLLWHSSSYKSSICAERAPSWSWA
ncbi:heterokaryon incompatibility protein-domain-containing protein, partial [Ilyonectria robusta]|uniref:heterokaryon incompatibility protein-domain-containing protein n=1 Tax=Ilyonectria robusta TaxID=1079257 RepID=UPI001E8D2B9C